MTCHLQFAEPSVSNSPAPPLGISDESEHDDLIQFGLGYVDDVGNAGYDLVCVSLRVFLVDMLPQLVQHQRVEGVAIVLIVLEQWGDVTEGTQLLRDGWRLLIVLLLGQPCRLPAENLKFGSFIKMPNAHHIETNVRWGNPQEITK